MGGFDYWDKGQRESDGCEFKKKNNDQLRKRAEYKIPVIFS